MYNGIGLPTPRGSGTNGYVTRNFASIPLRKKQQARRDNTPEQPLPVVKKPSKELEEHERKRKVEIKLIEWAEAQGLLDGSKPAEEVERIMAEQRQKIATAFETNEQKRNDEEEQFTKYPKKTDEELDTRWFKVGEATLEDTDRQKSRLNLREEQEKERRHKQWEERKRRREEREAQRTQEIDDIRRSKRERDTSYSRRSDDTAWRDSDMPSSSLSDHHERRASRDEARYAREDNGTAKKRQREASPPMSHKDLAKRTDESDANAHAKAAVSDNKTSRSNAEGEPEPKRRKVYDTSRRDMRPDSEHHKEGEHHRDGRRYSEPSARRHREHNSRRDPSLSSSSASSDSDDSSSSSDSSKSDSDRGGRGRRYRRRSGRSRSRSTSRARQRSPERKRQEKETQAEGEGARPACGLEASGQSVAEPERAK